MTVKKSKVSENGIQGDPEVVATGTPIIPYGMTRIAPALTTTYYENLVHHCGRRGALNLPPWDLYDDSSSSAPTLCNLRRALNKWRGISEPEPSQPKGYTYIYHVEADH